VGVIAAVTALVAWWGRGQPDLGVVSSQWIAEQRSAQGETRRP